METKKITQKIRQLAAAIGALALTASAACHTHHQTTTQLDKETQQIKAKIQTLTNQLTDITLENITIQIPGQGKQTAAIDSSRPTTDNGRPKIREPTTIKVGQAKITSKNNIQTKTNANIESNHQSDQQQKNQSGSSGKSVLPILMLMIAILIIASAKKNDI